MQKVDIEKLAALFNAASTPMYTREGGSCGDWRTYYISPQCTDRGGMTKANADAIVGIVNSLPALLAECRAAREQKAEAWAEERSIHYWEEKVEKLEAECRVSRAVVEAARDAFDDAKRGGLREIRKALAAHDAALKETK